MHTKHKRHIGKTGALFSLDISGPQIGPDDRFDDL